MSHPLLNDEDVTAFALDGAVLVRRLFADNVDRLRGDWFHMIWKHPGWSPD